ncbi:MAG: hypothetical protein CXT75_07700 [Methanobacteriota archaeon]|uniref:Uncharacterized protein n=1 Tax=Marine Group III euryarchaeote TaxID=2173149 RepID=A0A7J4GVU4_9ARCH|nr:MAG: hypothetical protein CXT75_07700 [Euryarchaeota archaeon]HIF37182.1 hypothetical protein [Marine Group III euryarchaeote]
MDEEQEEKPMTEEQQRIMKEKAKNLIIRTASVIEMLKETYYPGHSTTAKRVIERHLIREFGLKPRNATYHGSLVIESLNAQGIIEHVPEDTARNALFKVNLRVLQKIKT